MSCTVPRMDSLKKSFLLLSLLFLALVNADGSRHGHGEGHVGQQGHHGHSGHEDDQHGHGGGGGHGHREPERRVQREPGHHPQHHHESPGHHGPPMGGGPPCGCGGPGRQFMGGQQANGVPLFMFPEHAQKAVDVILGAEGAFYWDNDELAHRVFDLLAHKFPRHRFLVGVGNSPASGRGLHIERHSNRNLLHGSLKVSPGHTSFAFFDRRQFPRENETQLWYFVYAVEAQVAKVRTGEPRYAECLGGAENQCLPTDIAVKCGLDLLILIEQKTQPALYASDSLDNPKMLNVLSSVNRCQAETQEGEGREAGNNTALYAVMATDWNADVQKSKKARKQEVSESEEV